MENNDLLVNYPDFFTSEIRDDTLWLKFSGNFFHNIIDFDCTNFLSDYLGSVANTPDIKSVVLHSSYNQSSGDEYLRFFLFECPERRLDFGFTNEMSRYDLHRFCNNIDRTILDLMRMEKMIIHICRGNVLSLFMNLSLSCDYRIVGADTIFYNIFHEIGMLPKGGGPFFLSRMLGPSKAKELLLLQNQITAQQAYENGIVDQIVAPDKLEDTAKQVANHFSKVPQRTLAGVKRLVNYSIQEVEKYLEFESSSIKMMGCNHQFDNQ